MSDILKSYRKVKKLPDFLFVILALIMRTIKFCLMRTRTVDAHDCINIDKLPYITVTWHNRLLFYPLMFEKKYRLRTHAMISPSRDGQYIADLAKQFGVMSVRGSSRKRAAGVLNEALSVLRKGNNISMTPDGPRGPKYKLSMGPILLSSMTGYPILPISVNASKYWQLRSWDNFQIPKPFCKLQLVAGESIKIPPDLSDDEKEKWRKFVEEKLNEVSEVKG